MKLKTIIFITMLIILSIIIINMHTKKNDTDFKPVELEVGDVFNEIDYSETMYVLNYAIGDVTSDGKNDMVIVVGNKESIDNIKAQKVDVVVYDKERDIFIKTGIKNYTGQNPKIQLNDFTGDGVSDILVSLENDDKTINLRIITLNDNVLKEIWTRKDNRGLVFVGEIVDGIKAHLRCGKFSKETYVDLSDMKSLLLEERKINESGKIISEDKSISTSGIVSLDIIELNGQKGIQITQKMVAFSDTTMIDEITSIWKYVDGKWNIIEGKTNRLGVVSI